MSLAPIATGKTTRRTRSENPAFQDASVRGALRSLHTKIDMLADLGSKGKALVTHDAYVYGAKPYCKKLLDANYTPLKGLAAGGPSHKTRDNQTISHASIQYGWFVNALAGHMASDLIMSNLDQIFGKGQFRAKVEEKLSNYPDPRQKANYLKRTYASSIKRWYVGRRLELIKAFLSTGEDYINRQYVQELLQTAIAAKRSNMTVGAYLRANPRRAGNSGFPTLAPFGAPAPRNFNFGGFGGNASTTSRSTSSSSSSSSSASEERNPEEIDLTSPE